MWASGEASFPLDRGLMHWTAPYLLVPFRGYEWFRRSGVRDSLSYFDGVQGRFYVLAEKERLVNG